SVFRAVRSPKLLLKERQVLSSRISIPRWKQWGKLSKSVVRAAAANSNKGLLIDIWPRTTSGFTGNCIAVHLLKRQRDLCSPTSSIGRWTCLKISLTSALCPPPEGLAVASFLPGPAVPAHRVVL